MSATSVPPDARRAPAPNAAPVGAGDVSADILREAWRPGTAEPVVVHVRPELGARLVESGRARNRGCAATGSRRPCRPIPVLVDDQIPAAPGFEVHRAPPPGPGVGADVPGSRMPVSGPAREAILTLAPSGDDGSTSGAPDDAGDPQGKR
jgi:hypothetical protein